MIIDGKMIAKKMYTTLQQEVEVLKRKSVTPHLVVILVGEDPASVAYVRQKKLRGEEIGMKVTVLTYPNDVAEQTLIDEIEKLNQDSTVHGIIIQQPLPKHIDAHKLVNMTSAKKDVDGFHYESPFAPPIAGAVLKALDGVLEQTEGDKDTNTWLKDKKISIIGKGGTGGKPIREEFEKLGVKPKVIDSKTESPEAILAVSDIIVSCIGKPSTVDFTKIKKGCILIGVGMFRGENGKLRPDYDENVISQIASYYTPVPGGIGPLNVAMLLKNVIIATKEE